MDALESRKHASNPAAWLIQESSSFSDPHWDIEYTAWSDPLNNRAPNRNNLTECVEVFGDLNVYNNIHHGTFIIPP